MRAVKQSSQTSELIDLITPDGGWGYAPGQPAQLEPTCLALLALVGDPDTNKKFIASGCDALERCRGSDGMYRLANGREEAIWPTAIVVFVKSVLGVDDAALSVAVDRLLALRGRLPETTEQGELHDIDLKLVGWPWGQGNFSWVEPTAWACIALRRAGRGDHPRVAEGLRLLLDRAMDEGGINYGNRRVLGRMTDPIPVPTCLMLLAVQGIEHPRINAALRYLLGQATCQDVENLCWIKLTLDAYRERPEVAAALPQFDAAIAAALDHRAALNWVQPAPLRLALTALALPVGQRNPFRLTGGALGSASPATEPPLPAAVRPGWTQRLGRWFRGLAVKAVGQLRPPPAFSGVHIARAPSYDDQLVSVLRGQFEYFRAHVPLQGKRVVLKPNLVEFHRDKVINTDPRFVSAVIELCKQEGAAEIVVAEGPGHWRNVEYLVDESGLGDVLKQHGVRFVDLNHDVPVKSPNLGRLTGLDYLFLARTVAEAEVLISLPKLKTHHWAGATLSLKNLFGTLPGICYGWPKNELHWRGIDNSIVDIALTRTPELAIVDGIVGMEGDGPLNGTARPFGAVIMGCDLLAVDATCCRLMELNPEMIGYLVLGHAKKLGRMHATDIQQLGETIEALAQPFATVPHLEKLRKRRSA
ncbi:MAG: DUF362 domain-containing protein [Planctomycetes bacterium]|nr:DUF362 domain-containing protein [Planctomycetota bacterium]